ncbi:hypothetical protein PC117_g13853 [Phytophthora cactorum]|uniref:Uncharacterized protein n=1 Tax=Phytophthora cactorum TaxID=29920 RepID=A0A8T1CY46_9STRA|nr:hypothetical protein PC117_g13853 [Phytophthora cactorum]
MLSAVALMHSRAGSVTDDSPCGLVQASLATLLAQDAQEAALTTARLTSSLDYQ